MDVIQIRNLLAFWLEKLTSRHCSVKPIGGVLLADNLPTLFVKLTFPFFISSISAWSSGTGGAGLIGSFSYAFLTESTMGNLSPRTALLIQVFIPVLFAIT
uniref:Battenin n=1 Tax=Heterorhabditis bacteriophora TaxID=37862 RepID=A0A1I7W847_HETBA